MDRFEQHGVKRPHQPAYRIDDELQRVARRHREAEREPTIRKLLVAGLALLLVVLHELVPFAMQVRARGLEATLRFYGFLIVVVVVLAGVAVLWFRWRHRRTPR